MIIPISFYFLASYTIADKIKARLPSPPNGDMTHVEQIESAF
jgi:hypothetical protein